MPLKLRRGRRNGNEKLYTAHVKLLDNTIIDINLTVPAKGKDCLEKIAHILGLQEVDYFGLQYLSKKEKLRWVELDKCLRKQLDRNAAHRGRSALLVFKVQFFVVNINSLRQEITRYLYYLQLKTLILNGRLKCQLPIALKLSALAVQAELGDYNSLECNSIDYLADFMLLPNYLTEKENTEELNNEIMLLHKESSGLSPGNAEKAYVLLCQKLDGYGVELFPAKDKDNNFVNIGACSTGIKIVQMNNGRSKCVLYRWQDINNMAFNRQHFVFSSVESSESINSLMEDMDSSKYLWKLCVSQHQFFRLSHNTLGRTAFRTQHEVATDPRLFIKMQQSPTIKRRLTLPKRRAKEKQQSERSKTSKGSDSSNDTGFGNGTPLIDESVDETEFLHRYEDICNLSRDRSDSWTSRGSTPGSSEYNTSDSESEADSRDFRVQPIAVPPPASTSSSFRPVSLIFTRLSKIENQHRDQLLRHLERLVDENVIPQEYSEIFTKKVSANFTTALENVSNNRSADVLPYEDNRVLLNPNNNYEATNYINASPIKMNIGKEIFTMIVAQSPLKETVANFWQMIWEKNICVIAMISKEQENGVSKSCRYWPGDDSRKSTCTFGQVSITTNFNNFFAAYSIRSLHVQHVSSKESRTVFQIQYMQWPEDGGVPMWSKPFIEFLDEIHSIRKVSNDVNGHVPKQQTLVHCHNGGGRSGVVVLAEVLLGVIEHNETLDVPIALAHVRSQRMNLIETLQEYRFVYQLLIDYLRRNRLI